MQKDINPVRNNNIQNKKNKISNGVKILVVDDEEIMRNLFTDILQDRGYVVITVCNGKEAQQKTKDTFFHVAFIDVHMPVMNGVQTLRAIKELSPKTAIVMMDSFPDVLLDEAEREGAVTCIHKPFEIKELIEVIEEAIERKEKVV
ncbi:MAG: response regulator [Candidatus Omnitrophota bacterium]